MGADHCLYQVLYFHFTGVLFFASFYPLAFAWIEACKLVAKLSVDASSSVNICATKRKSDAGSKYSNQVLLAPKNACFFMGLVKVY
jgi:hypothetical protein